VRKRWLQWTVMNDEELARLYQPPMATGLSPQTTGQIIGAVGFVPCLAPFGQLSSLRSEAGDSRLYTTEFGLYYALSPAVHCQGYATEASAR